MLSLHRSIVKIEGCSRIWFSMSTMLYKQQLNCNGSHRVRAVGVIGGKPTTGQATRRAESPSPRPPPPQDRGIRDKLGATNQGRASHWPPMQWRCSQRTWCRETKKSIAESPPNPPAALKRLPSGSGADSKP
jgi:hypothetical protein